jgi:hypothetical protein
MPAADDFGHWRARECWRVLFTCQDCGADVVRFVRGSPDEAVRCFGCEVHHVHHVSDRLLELALHDTGL